MRTLIICGLLLSITSNVQCKSDYTYYSETNAWLKLHRVTATWLQAFQQCHNEGAVLASPISEDVRKVMQVIINDNSGSLSYFIGANSKFSPGQFVSIEGVPLENMPTIDMFQVLDSEHGECLKMDRKEISVVSCSKRLPYLCYKKNEGKRLTECGTFDSQYQLDSSTGSCYKLHLDLRTWPVANSLCIAEGGYLVILNNEQEARKITKMIPDIRVPWITKTRDWEPLYIGLLDWANNNKLWLTNHGDTLDRVFNVWNKGQPDDINQYCGAINRLGKFDNIWCNDKVSYFVCEKDPQNVRYSIEMAVKL